MGFDAVRDAVAVNSARADLQISRIETVLIGQDRVKGHGVGGDNELGAQVMQENATEVLDELDGRIRPKPRPSSSLRTRRWHRLRWRTDARPRTQRIYEKPVDVLGILPAGTRAASTRPTPVARSRPLPARQTPSSSSTMTPGEERRQRRRRQRVDDAIAQRVGLPFASGDAVEGVGESVVDSSEIINTLRGGGIASIGYASAEASEDAGENVNTVMRLPHGALSSPERASPRRQQPIRRSSSSRANRTRYLAKASSAPADGSKRKPEASKFVAETSRWIPDASRRSSSSAR